MYISLAWPDPFHTGTYQLEIINACAERVWPRETMCKWSCSKVDFKHETATVSISKSSFSVFKYRRQIKMTKEMFFINAHFIL